jgi:hypothetical protein
MYTHLKSIDLNDSLENLINLRSIYCYRVSLAKLSFELKVKGNYKHI